MPTRRARIWLAGAIARVTGPGMTEVMYATMSWLLRGLAMATTTVPSAARSGRVRPERSMAPSQSWTRATSSV